jgi:hypothetical protein
MANEKGKIVHGVERVPDAALGVDDLDGNAASSKTSAVLSVAKRDSSLDQSREAVVGHRRMSAFIRYRIVKRGFDVAGAGDVTFSVKTHRTHGKAWRCFRVFSVFRGSSQKLRSAPNRCGADLNGSQCLRGFAQSLHAQLLAYNLNFLSQLLHGRSRRVAILEY